MFFRFFYQLFRARFAVKLEVNAVDRCQMRVWPNDLDVNIHLNNGRYLSLMDLGRTRLSIRSGLFKKAKEMGWGYGVVGGLNITYFKSLSCFQKFTLTTKLAGHYDGWLYLEQRFESQEKLAAAALVKVTFVGKKGRIPAEDIIKSMGVDHIGENKEYLEHLFKSEQEFLKSIKQDYSSKTSQV